jgi:predicted CXXCH cytochrome family protein
MSNVELKSPASSSFHIPHSTFRIIQLVFLAAGLGVMPKVVYAQQNSIINSAHNLSVSGPGAIRAASEQEVCIFCHTPHNASPVQPLWNRSTPVNAYTVYSSSSLQAKPGQPTGSSKLCLSCHDGTIAVGSVLSREQPIAMAGGMTTLPPGHANLGTDLSDDHPISFRYDTALTGQDPKIKPPSVLPKEVKLDKNSEMQCTSCHDAHNNEFGKFLVMDNAQSQLCSSCHQIDNTTIAAHVACASCHSMHTAPSGPMLLANVNGSETCLACHSNQPTLTPGKNIAQDLIKLSRHYRPPQSVPMGGDESVEGGIDVTCNDCHEPHTMQAGTVSAPQISPRLGKVNGVNVSGGKVEPAQYTYEVCFKCHGDTANTRTVIPRLIAQTNTRLEFASNAISYHPVTIAGRNTDVPSLRMGLTSASMIYCTDCHSSDSGGVVGAGGATGPHGSNNPPLLVARYDTTDNTAESATAYALCYGCHDRTSILNDESFSSHKKHIQELNTPCSVCHDPHGISSTQGTPINNAHLINFDTSVVLPDPASGKIEYRSLGPRTGECTLSCHGAAHSPLAYPGGQLANPVLGNAGLRTLRAPARSVPSRTTPAPKAPAPKAPAPKAPPRKK